MWNRCTYIHEIFMQIPCGLGSVLLWRRCDTVSTSGFMDMSRLAIVGRMAALKASGVAIPGRGLMSMNALFLLHLLNLLNLLHFD